MTTLKCPHCKGLIAVTTVLAKTEGLVTQKAIDEHKGLKKRVTAWLNTPVTLSDLLIDSGGNADLTRFEPLDREVIRTAYRATDVIRALGVEMPPEKLTFVLSTISGWAKPEAPKRLLGVQGRWWVRRGYEEHPGFIDADDFDDLV